MPEVDISERIARLCHAVAERTGDGRLRTASAILTGKHSGRKAIDDTKALEYAEGLFKAGVSQSVHRACERAAQLYAPAHQVDTMRDRLRRKLRRKLDKSEEV
ncbi:hypothetical protein NB311A_17609 [Nitrobacter sp. Nb-311A]|nr:hypothetical protein NB311A_17609 [Nitrobacter sp. Nb-311A]